MGLDETRCLVSTSVLTGSKPKQNQMDMVLPSLARRRPVLGRGIEMVYWHLLLFAPAGDALIDFVKHLRP
jgi:hypothetical protein